MLSIDEAIEQFKYDAECNRADLDLSYAEDNEQLVEWLEELKDYRDKNKMVVRVDCNNIEYVKTITRAFVLACEEMSNCGCGDVELIKKYFIEKAGASNGTDNQ